MSRANVKDQSTSTALRASDKAELLAIAEASQRTVSWIISQLVHSALQDPENRAWLQNPVGPMPMAVSLSAVDKAKLEVLARACGKSANHNAADMLNASLDFPQVKIALVTQARKQLAQDPTFEPAQTVLKSFGLSLTPPAPVASQAPAAAVLPAPTTPAADPAPQVEPEPEPEQLTAEPGPHDQPVFDVGFLAPPDSRPGQKVITQIAGAPKPGGEQQ